MDVARLLSRRHERCRPPRSFRHLRKADRSWLGPGRRIYRGTGEVQAVSSPTLLESSQPGAALLPANFRRFGQFLIVALGVLTIVFLLQRLSGDPTNLLLPIDAPDEVRAEFESSRAGGFMCLPGSVCASSCRLRPWPRP